MKAASTQANEPASSQSHQPTTDGRQTISRATLLIIIRSLPHSAWRDRARVWPGCRVSASGAGERKGKEREEKGRGRVARMGKSMDRRKNFRCEASQRVR
jgi:hypothetical protein